MNTPKTKRSVTNASSSKPTIASCVEVVIGQGDNLINAVIDGLNNSTERAASTMSSQSIQNPAVLAAVGSIMANRDAVRQKFVKRLRKLLYAGLGTSGQTRNVMRFEDLRLFEEDQLDDSIEVARAQQEINMTVEKSLPQLDALISSLMGWITVQPHLNPLRPEIFIHALRDSLKDHAPNDDVRSMLITPAAGRLGMALDKLYRKVSDWLMMHGIEPAGPTLGANTGAVGAAAPTVSNSVAKTMLTLDKLRRLLTGETADTLPSDSLGKRGSGFMHTMPMSLKAIEDGDMMEAMVSRMTREAEENPEETRRKQEEAKQALQDGQNIGKLLGEEVTRVMLDNLLQDQRLLPSVKRLLKALEPSLLDLSKIDLRFFSDEDHPGRQFLSLITNRAVGYASDQDEGFPRFFKSIQDAVSEVVHNYAELKSPDMLTGIYEEALVQLVSVWERTDALVRAQQEQAAKALLMAEQRNTQAQALAKEFHALMEGKVVPDAIREFIIGIWTQVVAKAQIDIQGGARDPRGYRALTDDLIWSAQYRVARKDRTKLMALIPSLLAKLRLGLKSIDYPIERVSNFLDELLKVHEMALEGPRSVQREALYKAKAPEDKPVLAATASEAKPSAFSASQLAPQSVYGPGDSRWGKAVSVQEASDGATASAFIDFTAEQERLQQLALEGDSTTDAVTAAVDSSLPDLVESNEQVAQRLLDKRGDKAELSIEVGTWVEIYLKDRWTRAQLTWQSPRKTMHVFVSGSGTAHSMSSSALDKLMGENKIRLVSDGKMVKGALDAVAEAALQNSAQRSNS